MSRDGDKDGGLPAREGDHVAVVGENRKCWSSRWPTCPKWARARWCAWQKYKDGGLSVHHLHAGRWAAGKDPAGRTRLEPGPT